MSVRVRYAPSPTGSPHVGNMRDALFKHLLAKHHGGVNILRIEDTDRTRYIPEAEQEIMDSLHWLGIEWQEGPDIGGPYAPYHQSMRKEAGIYAQWIQVLLEKGMAYKAFDTAEELAEMREYQQINKQPIGYFGGVWRDAPHEKVAQAEMEGKPYVIRQKVPRGQTIAIEDAIRGRIEWNSDDVDDPVLLKADGMPTYHFAAMVDDHLMGITHIIRGEEWISSAPKHAALFDAFGWERPIFVHCPVIKGKDGKKLSKRHGDTRCLDYRAAGFLPVALINFIALIGWSPGGDKELMDEAELIKEFDIEGLQPSPGVFDMDKLLWMNGHYLRQMDLPTFVNTVKAYLEVPDLDAYFNREAGEGETPRAHKLTPLRTLQRELRERPELAAEALALEQERVTTMADLGEATAFFFTDEPDMDPKAVEKWLKVEHANELRLSLLESLKGLDTISKERCEELVRGFAEAKGFEKLGPAVHPTRVMLTGKTVGPGLFELMAAIGPASMAKRLERAAQWTV